ncbi:MAG: helix-turn-helix domain-containing protein [Clostridiales bacterium]|nr:helix-turn-helix domain-containing protein [Clostridiales bacterium]
MNIEIANRLVNLRKSNNLSQEALAEKLGISRQAVSKWERAEASPDTDNLILLARLYGVSLDELLKTEDEIPAPKESAEYQEGSSNAGETYNGSDNSEYVNVGFGGVHVKDKDGSEVHVGWDGIHVDDKKSKDSVHIDKNGVYVNGQKYDKEWFTHHNHFPFSLMIVLVYVIVGVFFNAWHPAWLLFFLIPLWHSFVSAVKKRNMHIFAYPVLATLLFLCAGFFMYAWHPGWVIFLTIPIYYSLVAYIQNIRRENEYEEYRTPHSDNYTEE